MSLREALSPRGNHQRAQIEREISQEHQVAVDAALRAFSFMAPYRLVDENGANFLPFAVVHHASPQNFSATSDILRLRSVARRALGGGKSQLIRGVRVPGYDTQAQAPTIRAGKPIRGAVLSEAVLPFVSHPETQKTTDQDRAMILARTARGYWIGYAVTLEENDGVLLGAADPGNVRASSQLVQWQTTFDPVKNRRDNLDLPLVELALPLDAAVERDPRMFESLFVDHTPAAIL